MAIKLSSPARWLKVRKFVDYKYGIKLNFSDSHTNYYTAYEYVVREVLILYSLLITRTSRVANRPRPPKFHVDEGRVPRHRKARNANVLQYSTWCRSFKRKKFTIVLNLWHCRRNGKVRAKLTVQNLLITLALKFVIRQSKPRMSSVKPQEN